MSTSESAVQAPSLVKAPTPYHPFSSAKPLPPFSAGGLLRGSRLAWLLGRDGSLRFFKSVDGGCVSEGRLVPRGCSIAAVCGCELDDGDRETTLLALAVHPEENRGKTTVAIVNAATSEVLRTVKIPWDVSSLSGVSGSCLQAARGLFSPTTLGLFSGTLAVGCAGGRVLLVDLSLDVEFSAEASVTQPQELAVVENGAGPAVISSAREKGRHACIDILAAFHSKGQFEYRTTATQPASTKFQTKSLAVTSLHFVPQILSLLIGYSMGGFQLFNVQRMTVTYSGTCPKVPSPVTHFTYQEPENDPKNNVYLWVARGNLASANLNVETKLALYQLSFAHKVGNSAGTMYQNLSSCGLVFLYPLTPTPTRPLSARSVSSNLLSCHTIEMKRGGRGLDESHDETANGSDLTIAVFVWGCGDSAQREWLVGVFDLNQYYHSQVPKQLYWKTTGKHTGVLGCSYFTFYSLKSMVGQNSLMDAAVGGVVPFVSLPPVPEIHLWPSALKFFVTAMTSEGFLKCSCNGLQRSTLEELNIGGAALFACPQNIFSKCERAELFGSTWHLDHSRVSEQQKTLLSVALEYRLTYLLKSLAHTWMEGGSATFGVFLDWVGSKLDECNREKTHLCLPLFSGAADSVDKSLLLHLNHLQLILYHLSRILTPLLLLLTSSPLTTDDPLLANLSTFYVTATTSHMVTKVSIWCLRNGLLPVSTVSSEQHFHYPVAALTKLCDNFRSKVTPCKLSVDHLCEELQADYCYPATSLEGLFSIFTSAKTQVQHTIMMYFLCDISNLEDCSFDQDKLLKSYSAEFLLPKRLPALAKGLWALDHMQYQVAVANLIGGQFGALQWFPWQHEVVVSLLLKAADTTLAPMYIDSNRNFVNNLRLQLKAYLAQKSAWHAIRLLRPYEDSVEIDELFGYFLDLCFEHKCLKQLVNLPLNEFEDAAYCCYLENSPCFQAQELLVIHYMQHYRYSNAIGFQEKIRPVAMADPDPSVRERSKFRDRLLAAFRVCMPHVVRELGESVSRDTPSATSRLKPKTKAKNPPLSSVLAKHEAKTKVASSAEFIYQEMTKISESRQSGPDPISPFRRNKFDVAAEHTPFFSPPPSVRKAMWLRSNLHAPVVHATPSFQETQSHVSVPDHHTSGTVSGLSSFRTHMEKFKERMFQLSQKSIDPACITTPTVSKPMKSTQPMPQPPPSILKVRGQQGEGPVEKGEGPQDTPTTLTRRIRFAEEATSQMSGKSAYTTCISSPPLDTAASAEIPLPSSDDSDLYYSFSDSPSPPPPPPTLTPTHPPTGTPSQSPLPKTQLFIGADDDDDGAEHKDDVTGGHMEVEVQPSTSAQSDLPKKSHDQDSSLLTRKERRKTMVTRATATPLKITPQKIKFETTRSLLTREKIGHHSSPKLSGMDSGPKTTPTGRSGAGLFAPHHPSPLSYSITSNDPPQTSAAKAPKSIFSLETASELVGAKKGKLSLESARREAIEKIQREERAGKPAAVTIATSSVSSVMVPVMSPDREKLEHTRQSSAETDVGGHMYHFSPGKVVSPPPVEQLLKESSYPSFAFSPPLTRSAARRKALGRGVVTGEKMGEKTGDERPVTTTRSKSPPDQLTPSQPRVRRGQRRDLHVTVRKSSRLLQKKEHKL